MHQMVVGRGRRTVRCVGSILKRGPRSRLATQSCNVDISAFFAEFLQEIWRSQWCGGQDSIEHTDGSDTEKKGESRGRPGVKKF